MTTTGRGLGWPAQDRAGEGLWTGSLPYSGLGWPALTWMAGTPAASLARFAAWHAAAGAGLSTAAAGIAAFPAAGGEPSAVAGPSASLGCAASAGLVGGYVRRVADATGIAASSEHCRPIAPAPAAETSSQDASPAAPAAAVAVSSTVAWRASSEPAERVPAKTARVEAPAIVRSISTAALPARRWLERERGDRRDSWGSSQLRGQRAAG
jgi:hypothetical protein